MLHKVTIIRQPEDSNVCGQACCAMLCNISLDEACMLARTHGQTTTKILKRILHAMNVMHDDRRTLGAPEPGETALLFFRSKDRKQAHWVLYFKKKYYDPNAGAFKKIPRYLTEKADLTSHLKVYP